MKKIVSLILTLTLCLGVAFSLTSCGDDELNFGKEYKAIKSQVDVLIELNAKSIDVGVMDSIMAGYYMTQDSAYANSLMIVEDLALATEQYGIAARKGSGLAKMISKTMIELAKTGVVDAIAEAYGIKSELCIDTTKTIAELTDAEKQDWDYIKANGKVIIGYTDFAPISYEDANGNLIGFDVDLAKAVCAVLGITPEFVLIDWNTKEAKLEAKTIDCIWNGMTITEERLAAMEITIPYLNNKQVAVIRKADADKYKTTDDMADAIIGAESGSAGESCIVKESDK